MIITYPVLKKEETYVDVAKEVKKSFFRKETVHEKKLQERYAYEFQNICFNGWKIEHFEREYQFRSMEDIEGGYKVWFNWDYCLREDLSYYVNI